MKQKHLSTIIVLAVALAFILSACATLTLAPGTKDYYTIDMYIDGQGPPISTNLPNEARDFINPKGNPATFHITSGLNATIWSNKSGSFLTHWCGRPTGRDVGISIRDKNGKFISGWIYNAKGIPIKAEEKAIIERLYWFMEEQQKKDTV